jgi:hypothetical protein
MRYRATRPVGLEEDRGVAVGALAGLFVDVNAAWASCHSSSAQ